MLEPPADLADDTLRTCLVTNYRLAVTELTFLPLGHDAWAWVYRARTADGGDFFVKVRKQVTNPTSLLVPRFLQDHGVAQVVAPLPTAAGALWAPAGTYAAILYPFVEGQTGMMAGMSDQQWIEYGALLRQIHDTPPSPDLAAVMRRDDFTPEGAAQIRRLDAEIGTRDFADPMTRTMAAFWLAHRDLIRTVLSRAEHLGHRLVQTEPPLLLCHADIHTNNVLLDADQRLWVVDWDETLLAPRERDLMFALGGISIHHVRLRDEALFRQGYGAVTVDPLALAYYRYAWATSDIGAYGEQIFFRPDLGPLSQRDNVARFQSLFAPGYIVSIALASAVEGT